ncbi:MAG: glycosyltransferase family 2 protein, partial [Candidatus Hydrogenedentes bacterium]|nr:glycosyltransferase family 2 protein [Candidatus Hydrogenedentota bacterium]
VQFRPPFAETLEPQGYAAWLAESGVVAATLVLSDPFADTPACASPEQARRTVSAMNELARCLDARDIEATIYGLPLCLVDEDNRGRAGNTALFFEDHQQYVQRSYAVAARLFKYPPLVVGKLMLLGQLRQASFDHPVDNLVAEWLLLRDKGRLYAAAVFLRRLTSHRSFLGNRPKASEIAEQARADKAEARRARAVQRIEGACATCGLRWVCDHESAAFKRLLPGLDIAAQSCAAYRSPLAYVAGQRKYYDVVDAERCRLPETWHELARRAHAFMAETPPALVRRPDEYYAANTRSYTLSGAVRWHSWTNTEKLSTNQEGQYLAGSRAPFALSYAVGAGTAEYAGFCAWDGHQAYRIVCPLVGASHEIALFVDEEGRYVLLRDGTPVRPAEFDGRLYLPLRLPTGLELRLSIWNIQERILTQDVKLWGPPPEAAGQARRATYSIVVFSTRFARRLQAALQSIAHQRDFDMGKLEVIVGYVPGLDATDDVLDSMRATHPALRIVRSPFPEQNAHSKGYVINHSIRRASAEWIVLIDSDILLPPDFFARLEQETPGATFIAPDGRYMLSPATTAQVLLGEVAPWADWPGLLETPGELRRGEAVGVPIGFCQVFKASCHEQVQYAEYEHFEGADCDFGLEMRKRFGPEKVLDGVCVAHLDHGGSQWFGTQKHL